MFLKDTVFRNLLALLFVFIVGYGALIMIYFVFNGIVEQLDNRIKNEQARYKIGEHILKKISDIESKFYKITTLFREDAALQIKQDILKEISLINEAIDVLENGGILKNRIELNLVELSEVIEEISYNQSDSKHAFEGIDLKPKLVELQKKLDEMINMIKLKQNILEEHDYEKNKKRRLKIEIFFKQMPSHFIRMRENTSRLLYESKRSMFEIDNNIQSKKSFYLKLEIFVTLSILSIVMILGYILSRQIQRTNKQLRIAKDSAKQLALEAEQANIAKSRFLANMSHDIRTPLNAIIGFSDLLCYAQLPIKEQEHANIVSRSAKSLLDIINDILDISKVESGKFEIISEPFNIRESLEQMVELFSVKAKEKQVRFIYNTDPRLPIFLMGDFVRLQQVFSNLLSNAIKFTPKNGCVCFNVEILNISQHNIILKFAVTDSGIGISKEQQKNIFDPFTQADGSILKKYGGTGLGLSISLKIIKMMGSKIELDSDEGSGSCFHFNLEMPILKNQENANPQIPKTNFQFVVLDLDNDLEKIRINLINYLSEFGNVINLNVLQSIDKIDVLFFFGKESNFEQLNEIKQRFNCPVVFIGNIDLVANNPKLKPLINYYLDTPIYSTKVFNVVATACQIQQQVSEEEYLKQTFKGKILVAEDNINNQKLIEILLNKLGLECEIANNGQEALELYQMNEYDLIFMDVNMPVMDGITAVKKIKALNKSNIPIIALTANAIKGDKEIYLAAGMDDYLSKPLVFKELVKTIHRYIETSVILSEPPNKVEIISVKYNKSMTMQQLELDEETVDMLLNDFFATLDDALNTLRKAIEINDNITISKAAHYLKGSCANLVMQEAEELLKEMEINAKENKNAHYEIERLEQVFEKIKATL